MINNNFTIKQILNGKDAFYAYPHCEKTRKEILSLSPPKNPIYTCNTENKVWRIAKDIFSIIIFPIGLYKLIHLFIGKVIVIPASLPTSITCNESNYLSRLRNLINNDSFKLKRLSIETDGYLIDATILGQVSTLENDRWLLLSLGNKEFYEEILYQ